MECWWKRVRYGVQVQTALGAIVREPSARELPCGVFGSFGWSGEAVDELENRLKVHLLPLSPPPSTFDGCCIAVWSCPDLEANLHS